MVASERSRTVPGWLACADLACVAVAAGAWYAFPQAGPWPLLLALAPWPARLLLAGRLTRRTPFDVPLLFFALAAGASVWAAYDRAAAWPKFWLIAGGILLFYALANAGGLGNVRAWLVAMLGAGVALYFLATNDWGEQPAKLEALTRLGQALQAPLPVLPGHRLHPNVAGGIMAMMWPFAGWVALRSWRGRGGSGQARWAARVVSLGAVAVVSFGLVMTTSRGAWIALAAALLVAGLWAASDWLSRGRGERRAWILPALAVAALMAVLAVGLAWPGGVAAMVQALPGPDTALGRAELVRNTLTLVRDYPLVGAGLGGFQMLYSTYVLLLHVGFTVHSHNLFLNVAVEQGLVALLALVWAWLLFGRAVWRRGSGPEGGLLGAAALSLVVVLVHGLVDDVLYGSRGVLLLFVPLAFAVPPAARRAARASRRANWRAGWPLKVFVPLAVGLLLAGALVWRGPILSLAYANLGAVHQGQAELGVYSWPAWPIQDEVRRQVDLGRPVAEFERALALDAGNPTANRRLGTIELSLGEYEAALGHLEAAYAAEPGSVTTRQLYGEALIVNGRVDGGRALWAEVNDAQGQLRLRAFWYQHIGDAERAAWVKAAAGER
jgi:hypothetical protein